VLRDRCSSRRSASTVHDSRPAVASRSAELKEVPFFPQIRVTSAGPAALADVLVHANVKVTPTEAWSRRSTFRRAKGEPAARDARRGAPSRPDHVRLSYSSHASFEERAARNRRRHATGHRAAKPRDLRSQLHYAVASDTISTARDLILRSGEKERQRCLPYAACHEFVMEEERTTEGQMVAMPYEPGPDSPRLPMRTRTSSWLAL
jgi:hypothetical protein